MANAQTQAVFTSGSRFLPPLHASGGIMRTASPSKEGCFTMTPCFSTALAAISAALVLIAAQAIAQPARTGEAAKACESDVKTLCPDVQPGQGRIAQCLRKHRDKVSEGCKAQMKEMRAHAKERRAASSPQ
jgi:hypothetical protein